jgi:UDP-glucose 4-epimerase
MSKTVLVTGASGFVAAALIPQLTAAGWQVRAAERRPGSAPVLPNVTAVASPDLGPDADWAPALAGCDAVIHLAARVHVMRDTANDPLAAFRASNSAGTARLAQQAAAAGVQRMVLVSSIKVNGEGTAPGRPYRASDVPAPMDPYGQSKAEGEEALWAICAHSHLQGVVIRPPLVYGPGVKGNFASLMRAVAKRRPLPLGSVDNRRSLVAVDNLASALVCVVSHPAANGQTFLVSDDETLSTPDLIRRLAVALGRRPRLVPVPPSVLRLMLSAIGKGGFANRLMGSLEVDSQPLRDRCGWVPVQTIDQGLQAATKDFTE